MLYIFLFKVYSSSREFFQESQAFGTSSDLPKVTQSRWNQVYVSGACVSAQSKESQHVQSQREVSSSVGKLDLMRVSEFWKIPGVSTGQQSSRTPAQNLLAHGASFFLQAGKLRSRASLPGSPRMSVTEPRLELEFLLLTHTPLIPLLF